MLSGVKTFYRMVENCRKGIVGPRPIRPLRRRCCRVERLEERVVLSGGVVTTALSITSDLLRTGLVVGDKFVGAGGSNGDSLLVRYNSNGTIDSNFGTQQGATVTPMVANNGDHFRALASAPDGKLVAGGVGGASGVDMTQVDFTLARYTANGILDTTFGSKGKVQTSFGTTDLLNGVLVLKDPYTAPDDSFSVPAGTIYAGGHNATAGQTHTTLLARYTPSGKLDTAFGTGGLATKVQAKEAYGLTLFKRNGDLRILQTGYGYRDGLGADPLNDDPSNDDFILVCYKLDGTLDTNFGTNGVVRSNILKDRWGAPCSQEAQYGNAVAIDFAGRILVGGSVYRPGITYSSDFAVARYLPNGTLDTSFGTGGYILTDFGLAGRTEDARSIHVFSNNEIVVAGITDWSAPQFVVARYSVLGKQLWKTTTTIGSSARPFEVAFLPDTVDPEKGRIIAAGDASLPSESGTRSVIALACYDAATGVPVANFGPGISIDNVTVNEGAGNATFTVTSPDPSVQSITYSTINGNPTFNGTATNDDYTPATAATANFSDGPNGHTATILVPITNDSLVEGNEVFYLRISNPVDGVDGTGSPVAVAIPNPVSVCTILDNEPALSIASVGQAEGDSGTTDFVFTVSLANPPLTQVTVNWNTSNGSNQDNSAVAGNDYDVAGGPLTFTPGTSGATSQTITVKVNGDTTWEGDEMFFVNLSSASNAGILVPRAAGMILNDDPAPTTKPTLSISDVSAYEGTSGTTTAFKFDVRLSAATPKTVTVAYATANGAATTKGRDYQAASGTLTFGPGATTRTITVLVNGDATVERAEDFYVDLSGATNATVTKSRGVGTIVNDDGLTSPLSLTASSASASGAAVSDRALYELLAADQFDRSVDSGRNTKNTRGCILADLVLLELGLLE